MVILRESALHCVLIEKSGCRIDAIRADDVLTCGFRLPIRLYLSGVRASRNPKLLLRK